MHLHSSVCDCGGPAGAADQITHHGLSMWPGLSPQYGGLGGVGFLTYQLGFPKAYVPVDEADSAMPFMTWAQKSCNISSSTHSLGEGVTVLSRVKMGTETTTLDWRVVRSHCRKACEMEDTAANFFGKKHTCHNREEREKEEERRGERGKIEPKTNMQLG